MYSWVLSMVLDIILYCCHSYQRHSVNLCIWCMHIRSYMHEILLFVVIATLLIFYKSRVDSYVATELASYTLDLELQAS